jgi:hypothetical protein
MSTEPLDWYFDVISPFAYLQWRRLRVRDELFWGFDATDLALAYREDENALDAEMRRLDAIPEAAQRRKPA